MRAVTLVCLLIVYFACLACTDAWGWGGGGGDKSSSSDSDSDSGSSSFGSKVKDTWDKAKEKAKETWDKAKEKAKETYDKVNDFVDKNPAVGVVAGAVLGAALSRGRRDVDDLNEEILDALDDACPAFDVDENTSIPDLILAGFMQADANGDGELSAQEFNQFAAETAVIEYCAGAGARRRK